MHSIHSNCLRKSIHYVKIFSKKENFSLKIVTNVYTFVTCQIEYPFYTMSISRVIDCTLTNEYHFPPTVGRCNRVYPDADAVPDERLVVTTV